MTGEIVEFRRKPTAVLVHLPEISDRTKRFWLEKCVTRALMAFTANSATGYRLAYIDILDVHDRVCPIESIRELAEAMRVKLRE